MALPSRRPPARHPRYTYLTADILTGAVLEEIPLGGVQFSRALNDTGTLTGAFAYTSKTAALLRPATTPARTALYALRDGRAVWGGIIWNRRPNHDARIVDISCADWWSYFQHRFITASVDFTDRDQNAIVRDLLSTAQAAPGGNLGVIPDTGTSGRLLDLSFEWFNYPIVGDAIRQIATDEGGPDLRFDTVGSVAEGFTRQLRIGKPRLGRSTDESGIVLDYGGQGAILDGLTEDEDGSNVESTHYALGPGSEEGRIIGAATRADLISNGWPLLEGTTTYTDDSLDSDEAMDARARADLAARAGVRTLPTGTTRGIAVGELDPGDGVLLEVQADWYNDDPSQADTGVWSQPTRVTSFTVNVPDDGSQETISPVFGDLVVTSRSLTRGAPSRWVEDFTTTAPAPAPTDPGTYGDGLYGDELYGE